MVHTMTKYKLPTAFAIHFEDDPVLKRLKEEGEEHNRPLVELFKASTAYLIDSRRYLFIELGRYLQQFGPLEPLEDKSESNYTEGTPIAIKDGEPEEEFQPLKALPSPEEKTKFSKKY